MYGVQSDYKNIYKEKLVYDYKDLLAGMGGTLSLFIGFAIFNIYEDLLDKTIKGIKRFQRRIFEVKVSKKSHDESIHQEKIMQSVQVLSQDVAFFIGVVRIGPFQFLVSTFVSLHGKNTNT